MLKIPHWVSRKHSQIFQALMEPLKILLIEDDEDYRVLIKDLLSTSGLSVEVEEAASSSEGLAALESKSFDCVLADYIIPGISGLEVIKTLKRSGIDTPVIILTAFGDDGLEKALLKEGACGYISKDALTEEILKQKIVEAVGP